MDDIFFDLYQSFNLETRDSRRARKKLEKLLALVSEALGAEKAEELQMAASIIREEEGLRGFIEGFRCGMTVISEKL